jgi:hypothetical protein
VRSILDAHYLHRDQALAESAIRKLEMGYAQRFPEMKTGTDSTTPATRPIWLAPPERSALHQRHRWLFVPQRLTRYVTAPQPVTALLPWYRNSEPTARSTRGATATPALFARCRERKVRIMERVIRRKIGTTAAALVVLIGSSMVSLALQL